MPSFSLIFEVVNVGLYISIKSSIISHPTNYPSSMTLPSFVKLKDQKGFVREGGICDLTALELIVSKVQRN